MLKVKEASWCRGVSSGSAHTNGAIQDSKIHLDNADSKRIGDDVEANEAFVLVDCVVIEWVDEPLTAVPGKHEQQQFVRHQKAPVHAPG